MNAALPFSYIFASELHERLRWFVRLRWIAAAGLAVGSPLGPLIGFSDTWPVLAGMALFVAAYNLYFRRLLRPWADDPPAHYAELRACAVRQMVMDLIALLVAVHYTGGVLSPLLPIPVFHMAIGTIMLATRRMLLVAAVTVLGTVTMIGLEAHGVLAIHPAGDAPVLVNLAILVVLVLGTIYLTGSVTGRFKQRNIELHRTTTQLRERTDALQLLLAEKEELERQKSHYMRISAHQLRSPLGTIKTSIQVLLDGYLDPATTAGTNLLRGVSDRVDSLLAIVNDLLELAKMREGRAKAPWTRHVSLAQVLADIFDAKDPFAEERKVELVPHFITEGAAVLDWAVPPDLVYAFENLIDNAIKYSKPEGGRVTVDLEVDHGVATVVIADDGIGIPAQLLDSVFYEFVRAPNAKHHTAEGTGLGLSIVREAIHMHGGTVTIQSEEAVGTRFVVSIPLHHVPPEVDRLLHGGNGNRLHR